MNLKEASIRVVDFETTGVDPAEDRVCEVGFCTVAYFDNEWRCSPPISMLVNPGRPIPAIASAIHHLTDRDICESEQEGAVLPDVFQGADLYAAHNAEFDRAFARDYGVPKPWLCTYRLARHRLPDASSHKNQVLRYELGFIDVEGDAHRAGHDAKVTALILCHMLNGLAEEHTVESIVALAESPVVLTGKVGFGKHFDKLWKEVPKDYLQWMRRQGEKNDKNPNGFDRDQWHTVNALLA